jgi:Rrf2 family protein
MRLTKKLMFAIEAVLDVAFYGTGEPVPSKEIADRQGIPRRYLEQVLQQLVHDGILSGQRGPRGGYRLGRERGLISIADIVTSVSALEGARDPLTDPAGSELGHVVLRPIWQELEEQAFERLKRTSIGDLCKDARQAGIEPTGQRAFEFAMQ